jgi:EF hand domain-containing protein
MMVFIELKETTVMLNTLATLGLGLVTAVAAPATALADCGPAHPTAYPGPHTPGYGPAPVYAPAPVYTPAPPRAQRLPRRVEASRDARVLRQADYNRDGSVTLAEAHAYARNQFSRVDFDRNGVLNQREARNDATGFARGAQGRDGVVTLAEYDASVRDDFHDVDRNRDGYLSSRELGLRTASPNNNGVNVTWHWQL